MDGGMIIIGGGLAALRAGITAARSGLPVTMLLKDRLCTGSSFYPMMDIVACQCADGTPEGDARFLREILDTSLGMGDEAMNRLYIQRIPEAVRRMPELGIHPRLTDPKPACFAQTARPTYCWSGWEAIRGEAYARLAALPNVTLREHTFALDLVVRAGRVAGVTVCGPDGLETLLCRSVVLATGGFGDVYEHSLNTPDVSGDGQVLALHAGAKLINLEFLQFIPGFLTPAYKTVFREPALPYARRMADDAGNDLLAAYLPEEADRLECLRLRSKHGPFTSRTAAKWFDIAMMEQILQNEEVRGFRLRYAPEIREVRFTFITEYVRWLREEKKVDIVADEIRIAPFYHAANGGVKVGLDCQTAVRGLYACGEVSGGIHGADRQGGNSTGSCLVFGEIAGQRAAEHAQGCEEAKVSSAQARESLRAHYHGGGSARLAPADILPPLRRLMWRHANIVREEPRLLQAREQLAQWQADFCALPRLADPRACREAVKAAHFLTLSQALVGAMLARRESRGSHWRKDFPEQSETFAYRLETCWHEGALRLAREEVAP